MFDSGSHSVTYSNMQLTLNIKTLLCTERLEVRCVIELNLLNLGLYQDRNF